jgi:hypothetical protein
MEIKMANKTPNLAIVMMFWELGLNTDEIATRMGAREVDVYHVLIRGLEVKRKCRRDQHSSPLPA